MSSPNSNSGRKLSQEWNVPVVHALYHRGGTWFNVLERFPGGLFDPDGYIVFETKEQFESTPGLNIGKRLTISGGIKSLKGYVRMR